MRKVYNLATGTMEELPSLPPTPPSAEEVVLNKVREAKQTLADTDFKMTVDYYATLSKEEANELKYLRSVAREYVRSNEA